MNSPTNRFLQQTQIQGHKQYENESMGKGHFIKTVTKGKVEGQC